MKYVFALRIFEKSSGHIAVMTIILVVSMWLTARPATAQAIVQDGVQAVLPSTQQDIMPNSNDAELQVNLAPPLRVSRPQIGPQPAPRPVVSTNLSLSGVIGYGYGASPIGSGREIMTNPDDIDARSTVFDLSLMTTPEEFVFPQVADGERWIRVDLGNQQVIAYEGQKPVRAFIVSTGLPNYPTVVGEFRIRMKVSEQTMSGVGYNLPGVKWVQYFYSEYAFHGTYWHDDFGIPKSHGCVNMTNADAKWLFDWAGPVWDEETVWFPSTDNNPGTLVLVHP